MVQNFDRERLEQNYGAIRYNGYCKEKRRGRGLV